MAENALSDTLTDRQAALAKLNKVADLYGCQNREPEESRKGEYVTLRLRDDEGYYLSTCFRNVAW